MASRGFSKSQNQPSRTQAHKRNQTRRVLLETLERRELFAVGPQLLGIQTNSDGLLQPGDTLNTSPKEIIFRFDDGAGLDANTLSGIRLVRSGDDGTFDRASVATDLGTSGATLVEFYAQETGAEGNGITLNFTAVNRSDSRTPRVTLAGRTVNIELNSNPSLQTRVSDLLNEFRQNSGVASSLVYAQRLRGLETIGIGSTVDTSRPFVLGGANTAKASTNLGLGGGVEVQFISRDSGSLGAGTRITITSRDFGGAGLPQVTASGRDVSIELNSNARFSSTLQQLVDAVNASTSEAANLVEARLVSGGGATRVGSASAPTFTLTGGASDLEITPAYVGLGDTGREVIMRFASALPDDVYKLEILGQGIRALRSVDGTAFNAGVNRSVSFELDLGAKIESIVPQPVVRDANGTLRQLRNQIHVYFNDDDLSADATNAQFYQLFIGTSTTPVYPTAVFYDSNSDFVRLTFADDLATLGAGDMRLRIGTNEAPPLAAVTVNALATDAADTFSTATNLTPTWTPGGTTTNAVIISGEIQNTTPYRLDFPGGPGEPGDNDNNRYQNETVGLNPSAVTAADSQDGTATVFYNFQSVLGFNGNTTLSNAITEQQRTRVREIMSIYERHLGIRFVETSARGLTIGVGDTQAIVPFSETRDGLASPVIDLNSVGGSYYEAGRLAANGQLAAVMDVQDFNSSTASAFGGIFQRAAMQAVGRLIGLGLADDLPGFNIMAFNAVVAPAAGSEIVLPGSSDIVAGQYLYRPDSKDIDLYQFSLPTAGTISIEAFAERMSSASLLDTTIRLYQQVGASWVEIAANDDYFSNDSFIELELGQGNYIVGVSASGNNTYDPTIADSGIGGRSQGRYQLRLDFTPPAPSEMKDATGTPIDGDGDGNPGGVHNFWFRAASAANTLIVDKASTAVGTQNGSIGNPFRNINQALSRALPGQVVRIVGNGGRVGGLATSPDGSLSNNLAYEIGFDNFGSPLPDGSTFDVPSNVSVMIDAGAIIKMRRARVGVGSTTVGVDRSGGSLLVLGTPRLVNEDGSLVSGTAISGDVYFTSTNDASVGLSSVPTRVGNTPVAGDWGGIDFRNRIDRAQGRLVTETSGVFLNSVTNADIRYGGGQVVVDSVSQVITPVQMVDSRPAVTFSTISFSADAAISATPNSFEETNFRSPNSTIFVDYDRVGPDIHNNTLVGNSINGLQVKLTTAGATQLERMTVTGRFDDTDIVHVIPENLTIAGTPGGVLVEHDAPSSVQVRLQTSGNPLLAVQAYSYIFASVNAAGNEALSEPIAIRVPPNATVTMSGLPSNVRKIYRAVIGLTGTPQYIEIASFTSARNSFVDNGSVTTGNPLPTPTDNFTYRSRLDASLKIDAGTIVKLKSSRIDVDMGAQLIAEGDSGNPVVFTSIQDRRYGASGTFVTSSATTEPASAGQWGGIYVGHTSAASLDNVVVAYGGGATRIEGGFASFNPIEVHQADLRLTNSRLELNARGIETSTDASRAGRGANSSGAIFVLSSQPIISGNTIVDNLGAAISVNVDSLNHHSVTDPGRSSGPVQFVDAPLNNKGPLLQRNILDNNSINGLIVRGGVLTTEGVWDDTDIVHVVLDEIVVSNMDTFGGLRIMSSADASLVVKLDGDDAGFTSTGRQTDNLDRIGGAVQLVGTPNHSVVLTSLADFTVGAGWTLDGKSQVDTNNSGFLGETTSIAAADIIIVMDESATMGGSQDFSEQLIPQIETSLLASGVGVSAGNRYGLVGFGSATVNARSIPLGRNGELFGTSQEYVTAAGNLLLNGFREDGYDGINFALDNYEFRTDVARFIILVTDEPREVFRDEYTYNSTIQRLRDSDVKLQGILSVNIRDQNNNPGLAINANDTVFVSAANGRYTTTPNGTYTAFGTTDSDYIQMVHSLDGIVGDINQIANGGAVTQAFSNVLIDSIVSQAGGTAAAPGDWRSFRVETFSNDNNFALVNEAESNRSNANSTNDSPATAQYLGQLAPNNLSGDENLRLGYQIEGAIARTTTTTRLADVDTYSFRAKAGTQVWLDIDRTDNSLDTVIEFISADGSIIAVSDNTLDEELNPTLLTNALTAVGSNLSPQDIRSLRKSDRSLYFQSAFPTTPGAAKDPKDLYSTNPKDAGLSIVLPGQAGTESLYHFRVRAKDGATKGAYSLQVRLEEMDQIPGASVNYAKIQYATTGVELVGVPTNSPLIGENREAESNVGGPSNNTRATAQYLGNILNTNSQTISLAGSIGNNGDSFVDWFAFDIDYTTITPLGVREYFATVFDIDYADGLGGPDLSLYVYNDDGVLILSALGGNSSFEGSLSGSATASLDPFLGTYELEAGRYFLAVTNWTQSPSVMSAYTDENHATFFRMEPMESLQLIAEDRVDAFPISTRAIPPVIPVLFDPATAPLQFNLADVGLYVSSDNGRNTNMYLINPFTGEARSRISNNTGGDVNDIAFTAQGALHGFTRTIFGTGDRDARMDYSTFNLANAAWTSQDATIETSHLVPNDDPTAEPTVAASDDGMNVEAITFATFGDAQIGLISANRPTPAGVFPAYDSNTRDIGGDDPDMGDTRGFNYALFGPTELIARDPNRTFVTDGSGNPILDELARQVVNYRRIGSAVPTLFIRQVNDPTNPDDDVLTPDPTGRAVQEVDEDGNLVFETYPNGVQIRGLNNALIPRYIGQGPLDLTGNQPVANDNLAVVDDVILDTSGNTIRIYQRTGGDPTLILNPLGQAVQRTNAVGELEFERDAAGALILDIDGNSIPIYNGQEDTDLVLDANGRAIREYARDAFGNLIISQLSNPFDYSPDFSDPRLDLDVDGNGTRDYFVTGQGVLFRNYIYQFDIETGEAFSGPREDYEDLAVGQGAGTEIRDRGYIETREGIIRGIAVIGTNMYAISDAGEFYRVNIGGGDEIYFSQSQVTKVDSPDIDGLADKEFTSLTRGPEFASGGRFANMLFGTTSSGRMYAFDTNGVLQRVFAGGESSIQLVDQNGAPLSAPNGISFAKLDFNLWHVSTERANEDGHGISETPNGSRAVPGTATSSGGGQSFYFGWDADNTRQNRIPLTQARDPGFEEDTYNFAGGAAGVIESASIDLSSFTTADKPMLYFNYIFETENASSNDNTERQMRDSLRVYASGEDGVWTLLATNNGPADGRFDEFDLYQSPQAMVQPLFDNRSIWRQARVPLDNVAGKADVKIRIEFSTYGGFGYGLAGGKGAELRTIAGNRLTDGMTYTVDGEVFEIEMGQTLTVSGGQRITPGDSIFIDGLNFVFTDGTNTVAAPDVPVNYLPGFTASQVAAALNTAIAGATFPLNDLGVITSVEDNNTLGVAQALSVTGRNESVVLRGEVGDTTAFIATDDVDIYEVSLLRNGPFTATATVTDGSSAIPHLRLFNASGVEVASGTSINFTASNEGTFYLAISDQANITYNPQIATGRVASSNFAYDIAVEMAAPPLVLSAFENRIQVTGASTITGNSTVQVAGANGVAPGNHPIFVTVDMDANQVAQQLAIDMGNAVANGVASTFPVRSGNIVDLTSFGTSVARFGLVDSGPFGLTTAFAGDQFSAFNHPTRGAANNDFEGVFLDDFVIGLAGRGEVAMNAPVDDTFAPDPQPRIPVPNIVPLEIASGNYQLEIRGGASYGTPLLNSGDNDFRKLVVSRTDELSARITTGLSIDFLSATELRDGAQFTVSDGTRTFTFVLDDVNDGEVRADDLLARIISLPFSTRLEEDGRVRAETTAEIAAKFRNIINGLQEAGEINLTASLANGDKVGTTNNTVVLFGDASIAMGPEIGVVTSTRDRTGENTPRPQGQIIVSNAHISNSQTFGVNIRAADRLPISGVPANGSVINYTTTNQERLATGAVIMNTALVGNSQGGISVTGDAGTAAQPAGTVPFVRLVNNTIVGGSIRESSPTVAAIFDNQVFTAGIQSFADEVVSFTPGLAVPIASLSNPQNALGAPNYTAAGEPVIDSPVLSLGRGGRVVLRFTDNFLTGSGDANPDLRIFEVGDAEQVVVEVSIDGVNWTTVGTASGVSPTIDLDSHPSGLFNRSSRLAFVRLTDVPGQGAVSGNSVGADIDAVGAISSVPATIFTPTGSGISVTQNATATLLNNVLVNNAVALNVDASSSSTIVGGTVFQHNTSNTGGVATVGQLSNAVPAAVQLFAEPAKGNFRPATRSPLIDSGINSLQDRPSLVATRNSIGIPASPIIAPLYDLAGQLRIDDPNVQGNAGVGEVVFIDAGALEHNDVSGPSVVLLNPIDNDAEGRDLDLDQYSVLLQSTSPRFFDILLVDGFEESLQTSGSGIDVTSVSSSAITIFRNGVPLVEGIDYRFGFDATSSTIRLQPLAGVWQSDAEYEIRFLNSAESVITAKSGLSYTDGQQFSIVGADDIRRTFEFDTGITVSIPSTGGVATLADATTFLVDDGARVVTFEFDNNGVSNALNTAVSLTNGASPLVAAQAIAQAITGSGLNVSVSVNSNGTLQVRGVPTTRFVTNNSGLLTSGRPSVQSDFGLQIPLVAGRPSGFLDGQTFTIARGSQRVTFELDFNQAATVGNVRVGVTATMTTAQFADAIAAAISGSTLNTVATNAGNGLITLSNDVGIVISTGASPLTVSGVAGQPGAIAIPISIDGRAETNATVIKSTIDLQNIPSTKGGTLEVTQFGNRLVVEGTRGIAGDDTRAFSGITDLAGNPLRPNQENGQTVVTISLSEGYDYGDAPLRYPSSAANNGPRHTVVPGLSLGANISDDAGAQLETAPGVGGDGDDGATFNAAYYNTFTGSFSVNVTNTTGSAAFVSAWIDFNGDGVFDPTERVVSSQSVNAGNNSFTFSVPTDAVVGTVYARVRLSSDANAIQNATGIAPDGEVEDYAVVLTPNPYQNQRLHVDVNGDGFVSPIDVLQVINWINDDTKPKTVLPLPSAFGVPPFVDVTGDGTINAVDVIQVINYINDRSAGLPTPPLPTPRTPTWPEGEGEGSDGAVTNNSLATVVSSATGTATVLASDWFEGVEIVTPATRQATNSGDAALVAVVNSLSANAGSNSAATSYQAVDLSWADPENDDQDTEDTDASFDENFLDDLLDI